MTNQKQDVPDQSDRDWEKLQQEEIFEDLSEEARLLPEYLLARYFLYKHKQNELAKERKFLIEAMGKWLSEPI